MHHQSSLLSSCHVFNVRAARDGALWSGCTDLIGRLLGSSLWGDTNYLAAATPDSHSLDRGVSTHPHTYFLSLFNCVCTPNIREQKEKNLHLSSPSLSSFSSAAVAVSLLHHHFPAYLHVLHHSFTHLPPLLLSGSALWARWVGITFVAWLSSLVWKVCVTSRRPRGGI